MHTINIYDAISLSKQLIGIDVDRLQKDAPKTDGAISYRMECLEQLAQLEKILNSVKRIKNCFEVINLEAK